MIILQDRKTLRIDVYRSLRGMCRDQKFCYHYLKRIKLSDLPKKYKFWYLFKVK
jgi:hypothetical protein